MCSRNLFPQNVSLEGSSGVAGMKSEFGTHLKSLTKRRSVIIIFEALACATLLSTWLKSPFITAKYTEGQLTSQV